MTSSQQRPAKRFFIQARTFAQAAEYAKKNNLSPTQWTYLDCPEKMKGLQADRVVVEESTTVYRGRFEHEPYDIIVLECPEAEPKRDAEDSLLRRAMTNEQRRLDGLLWAVMTCPPEEYQETKDRVIECNKRLLQFKKFRDVLSQ